MGLPLPPCIAPGHTASSGQPLPAAIATDRPRHSAACCQRRLHAGYQLAGRGSDSGTSCGSGCNGRRRAGCAVMAQRRSGLSPCSASSPARQQWVARLLACTPIAPVTHLVDSRLLDMARGPALLVHCPGHHMPALAALRRAYAWQQAVAGQVRWMAAALHQKPKASKITSSFCQTNHHSPPSNQHRYVLSDTPQASTVAYWSHVRVWGSRVNCLIN